MVLTRNGSLLARLTGWRRVPLVLPDVGKAERAWILPRVGLAAVMRYHPRGAVLFGPAATGRRVLARRFSLLEAIERGNEMAGGHEEVVRR